MSIMVINVSIAYSQMIQEEMYRDNDREYEIIKKVKEKDSQIGVFFLSLHPLNLWAEEPNPMYDVLAAGLHIEGNKIGMMLGYASLKSHPEYKQEIYFGTAYLMVREEQTRVSLGVLAEFNFDESFNLPSAESAPIYQIGATLGSGVRIKGNLWFYFDIYLYKLDFARNGITGLLFYEQSAPLLPRLVYKF